jgi:hypothetical protein
MANLLDTIRQNTQQLPEQGMTDESGKLQTLLRAKSGKAVGGSPVATSSLGEQQAVVQTNQQIKQQVAPAAAIQVAGQQQQAQGIQQQEQLQRAETAQSRRLDSVQTRMRTDQMLKDLERNKGQVDIARQGAQLEQVATNLRLQNKQYVDQLNREGSLARLNDEAEFRKAALQATMGNKQQIINKTIDDNIILSGNDREFKRKVAQIDIGSAYAMFNADMAAGKQQAMWQGIGAVAKAGLGAYDTYTESQEKKKPSTGKITDTSTTDTRGLA